MKATRAWVGVDVGTSRIKALAWSDSGKMALAACETPWQDRRIDGEVLAQAALKTVLNSVEAWGPEVRVAAVGVTSMGETGLWVDRRGPCGPVVGWQDERDTAEVYARFQATFDRAAVFAQTGIAASPKFGLFRMAVQDRSGPEASWLQVADWVIYRWSGGARITHANLAARTMALDWRTASWRADLLEFAAATPANLPEIHRGPYPVAAFRADSGDRRLRSTILAHAGHDHASAYYGARLPQGIALDSSGTAEPWVLEANGPYLSAEALKHGMMWAPSLSGSGFVGLLPTPAGGAAERWARSLFGQETAGEPGGVEFRAEGFGQGRATFHGLGPDVRPAMLYEAVLTGVAVSLGAGLDALRQITGESLGDVAWTGGAVAHRRWTEIRLARIGARLWALDPSEAAALGALRGAMAADSSAALEEPGLRWRDVSGQSEGAPPWLAR